MFKDAAKNYEYLGAISNAFADKLKYFMIAAEFYIKDGAFEQADSAIKQAMKDANSYERGEIYHSIKHFYKKQGEEYISDGKISKASQIYEKLLSMQTTPKEQEEFKKKLLDLYEKLGKFKEYKILDEK